MNWSILRKKWKSQIAHSYEKHNDLFLINLSNLNTNWEQLKMYGVSNSFFLLNIYLFSNHILTRN